MDGLLLLDKPGQMTSFDVVRKVRRLLGISKLGHTGTLDPLATGLLVLCLGEACKLVPFLTELDKAYCTDIALGVETDTHDAQGKVLQTRPVPPLTPTLLETHLSAFRGRFLQVPPMHSAIKQQGKKLYELARQGLEVERPARPVVVHRLQLKALAGDVATLEVHCSKGFFVRSLAHELGKRLGCGAHVQHLRRLSVGPFGLGKAVSLSSLEGEGALGIQSRLVSVHEALPWVPAHVVRGEEARKVQHGARFELQAPPGRLRLVDEEGHLLALAEVFAEKPLRYLRVFPVPG